jgi:hypothetical protein
VFLDVVTSFGTMVWSPLNYSRVSWDWIFILDLSVTAIALVPQFAAWCYREPQKLLIRSISVWIALSVGAFGAYLLAATAGYGFPMWVVGIASTKFALVLFLPAIRGLGFRWSRANWCRVGLAVLCLYFAFAAVLHARAVANVAKFADAHQLSKVNLAALPLPPTLTHWSGLISTPEGVWRTTFHEPGGVVERTQFYSSAKANHFVEESKKLRDVQVYLWFARFPIWNVNENGGKTIVDISDVRFFREEEPDSSGITALRARVPGIRTNPSGFTLEVVFNGGGKVVSSGFKRPQ